MIGKRKNKFECMPCIFSNGINFQIHYYTVLIDVLDGAQYTTRGGLSTEHITSQLGVHGPG